MTRSDDKAGAAPRARRRAGVADAARSRPGRAAVAQARPDVIVHQLTALTGVERFTASAAADQPPPDRGHDHLLSAGHAVGVRRFVAQGVATFGAYARNGGP